MIALDSTVLARLVTNDDAHLSAGLALYLQGMDFASALHLIGSTNCERLMTFDIRFAQAAKRTASAQEVKLIVS